MTVKRRPSMTKEAARWYLAGMIDGEGCISRYSYKSRGPSDNRVDRRIRIANTDRRLLEVCLEAYAVLGIDARLYRVTKGGGAYATGKPRLEAWEVVVYRQSEVLKVIAQIPVQHPEKREKLAVFATEIGKPVRVIEAPAPVRHPEPVKTPEPEPVKVPG
jgi:hypothetical protein